MCRASAIALAALKVSIEQGTHGIPISDPADHPSPIGFGFVAKSWTPRVGFAGTYDDAWQKARAPLLPGDYNPRFTVAASEGLWAANGLHGGEVVDLVQLTPNGRLRFELPKVKVLGSYPTRW